MIRIILAYNPHNAIEKQSIDDVVNKLSTYVSDVLAVTSNEIRNLYKITKTPAMIILRDDLQGEHLFETDETSNQYRAVLACKIALEEANKNVLRKETQL